MVLEEVWPEGYKADFNLLESSNNENDFMESAFNYLRETCIISVILSNSCNTDNNGNPIKWTRNQAIICGSLIRITHLLNGFLSEIVNNRMETAMLFERSIYETSINIIYFIKKNDLKTFNDYVLYSLRYEKRLYMEIKNNIAERGSVLPIEGRMLRSIEKSFEKSAVSIDDVNEKSKDTWGGSIRNRFKYIEKDNLYDVLISRVSHTTHGNWQDLITHYLQYNDDLTFEPKTQSSRPRPQVLCALTVILIQMLIVYSNWHMDDCIEREVIIKR